MKTMSRKLISHLPLIIVTIAALLFLSACSKKEEVQEEPVIETAPVIEEPQIVPIAIEADAEYVNTTTLLSKASTWSCGKLKVSLLYNDGSREELTEGYTVDTAAVTAAETAGARHVAVTLDENPEISTYFTVTLTSVLIPDMQWYLMDPEAEDFYIDCEEELAGFKNLVDYDITFKGRTIHLTSDIDMAGATWSQIGTQTQPFEGSFDGGGHTISNLVISSAEPYTGFFENVRGDSNEPVRISNLTIENAKVTSRTTAGTIYTGIVVGNGSYVHLSGVTVKDSTLTANFGSTGAIAGNLAYSMIEESANIDTSVISTGPGTSYTGGIAGQISYTDIIDCSTSLSAGDTISAGGTSNTFAAGIVGYQRKGVIADCTLTLGQGARIAAAGTNTSYKFYAAGICATTLTATISGNTVNAAGRDQITCSSELASARWFLGREYTSGVILRDNTYIVGGTLNVLCEGSDEAASEAMWTTYNPFTR